MSIGAAKKLGVYGTCGTIQNIMKFSTISTDFIVLTNPLDYAQISSFGLQQIDEQN